MSKEHFRSTYIHDHTSIEPHDHDVLKGKGKRVNNHDGNIYYRQVVQQHKYKYCTGTRKQKTDISRLVQIEIKRRDPPGRFLAQNPVTKQWSEIDEVDAQEKIRQALREPTPKTNESYCPQDQSSKIKVDGPPIRFEDCKALTCKHILSGQHGKIWALESYSINGKQYLASASGDKTIHLWDLSENNGVSVLRGHKSDVYALVSYIENGVQLLASGSWDKTIELWNLTNNTNIRTLIGHHMPVLSLEVYKKVDKTILVSGSADKTIKLWDTSDGNIISTLQGHEDIVFAMKIFHNGCNPYLASGSHDETIKIWCLNSFEVIKTINEGVGKIWSLVKIDIGDKKILASGNRNGYIKLWSLESHDCIRSFKAHIGIVQSLDVAYCDGIHTLISLGDYGTIKVWNLQQGVEVVTICSSFSIRTIKLFMNKSRACLGSGHDFGHVKLWFEDKLG